MRSLKIWVSKIAIGALLMLGYGAAQAHILTIVNNYDAPLTFLVGKHPEIVRSLASELVTVPVGSKITTTVFDDTHATQADIRAQDVDSSKNSAFFGVGVEDQQVVLNGYIGQKIAYSWIDGSNATLIFCTPAVYARHNSCIF